MASEATIAIRVSAPTDHFSVWQLGPHEWLMKRAMEPMAEASMTISLLILKK